MTTRRNFIQSASLPAAMALLAPANAAAQPQGPRFPQPDRVRPFRVAIPQQRIDEILARVRAAKLPRPMPAATGAKSAWETGMDIRWLEALRQHWLSAFDWRRAEASLNRYPQYMARIEDVDIHFYYVPGEGANPLPLILTHGWPGSIVEFLDVIGPLTRPSQFGGRAEDAFTVIVPSLPGYAFSSLPERMDLWGTTTRI